MGMLFGKRDDLPGDDRERCRRAPSAGNRVHVAAAYTIVDKVRTRVIGRSKFWLSLPAMGDRDFDVILRPSLRNDVDELEIALKWSPSGVDQRLE